MARICTCRRVIELCKRSLRNVPQSCRAKINCNRQIVYPYYLFVMASAPLHSRMIDYNFIGNRGVEYNTKRNRDWVDQFVQQRFTSRSWLRYTDHTSASAWYDMSTSRGYIPRLTNGNNSHVDMLYFKLIGRSNFTLAPAGDALPLGEHWSMRFFESIMAGSIPIVFQKSDSQINCIGYEKLNFKFLLANESHQYKASVARHNRQLFWRHFTPEGICGLRKL